MNSIDEYDRRLMSLKDSALILQYQNPPFHVEYLEFIDGESIQKEAIFSKEDDAKNHYDRLANSPKIYSKIYITRVISPYYKKMVFYV